MEQGNAETKASKYAAKVDHNIKRSTVIQIWMAPNTTCVVNITIATEICVGRVHKKLFSTSWCKR